MPAQPLAGSAPLQAAALELLGVVLPSLYVLLWVVGGVLQQKGARTDWDHLAELWGC